MSFLEKFGYAPLFKNKTKSVFHHAVSYISGLLTLPRGSNMSRIAENIPESGSSRDISHFISSSPWSYEDVMKLTRTNVIHHLGPNGAVIFDETGQQKYGTNSVGTSHQYLGTLGHTCTAQVGVFASYCVDNISTLIDYRLFLPDSWVRNHLKSLKAEIPLERIEHKTKPELALEMLDSFISEEIPFSYIQADGLYGNDSKFISGLYQRKVSFICDIPSDTLVYITEPILIIPERQGNRGRFPSKPKVMNTFPVQVRWLAEIQQSWNLVPIRFTDRGIKTVYCAVITVWRRQDGLPNDIPVKLVMIRDPEEDMIRFAFTNMLSADISDLVKCQANRYWIERNFEDAKGLCDLDSFRGRSWAAWHHHVALSAISLFMLLKIQHDFYKKSIFLSLNQVVAIIRHKNPLRKLTDTELADSINKVNKIRAKMWAGNLKRFMKQRFKNSMMWIQNLIDTSSELII
jgi:SRSO17 transposase